MYNTPRAATIKALTKCKLWYIDRMRFRFIVTHFQLLRTTKYVNFLARVKIGGKCLDELLSKSQLEQISCALEREVFEKGEYIIRQGQQGDYFYIVEEGEVGVYKAYSEEEAAAIGNASTGRTLAILTSGCYFGEKALLAEDKRQASCVAETVVQCLTLGRDDFVMMLGNLSDLLAGKSNNGLVSETSCEVAENIFVKAGQKTPLCAESEHSNHHTESFSFENLKVVRTLGSGAFGRVKLVKSLADSRTFALKCQSKKAIVENGLQEHVMSERTILIQLDHPFILNLHGSFQDEHSIYFVLELLQGGELFTQLRSRGQLDELGAKFYAAQVLLAFAHIHSKNIAYRDLKPENLVLDATGYLKVVDFGLAKEVDGKTWTLCGTPDYLAPEIILNEGHDKAVDYWALGVLVYEIVSGAPPFYAPDPMEIYEKILSSKISMPNRFSRNLSDLVRKLCKVYQNKRLGNGKGGIVAIQKHKWFGTFDFKGLINRELQAPIKPNIKHPLDTSNFDDCPDDDPNLNVNQRESSSLS